MLCEIVVCFCVCTVTRLLFCSLVRGGLDLGGCSGQIIEINRRSLIGGVAVANGAAILEQGPYNGSLWRKNSFTVTTQSIVVGF